MIHTASQTAPLPFVRSSATVFVVGAFLVGVALAVLLVAGVDEQIPLAMLTGAGCIVAAVLSLAPASVLSDKHDAGVGVGFLMGTLARMTLTMAVILGLKLTTGGPAGPIAMWAGGWYLALLATEVVVIQRFLAERESMREQTQ